MKRNVLHFILDDLSPEHARTPARTPHIDGLAARGVRFGSAFCQFALCSPSRQSFFTGRSSCVCCSALLYRGTAGRHWRRQRLVDEAEVGVEQQSSTS